MNRHLLIPSVLLRVHAPVPLACFPGSVSGAWPVASRVPLGQPLPSTASADRSSRLCSAASSVLWVCPTSRRRTCRRTALPSRPAHPISEAFGISRFPCKEFPHMHRVSDRAGPRSLAHNGRVRVAFRIRSTASAPRICDFAAQYLVCVYPCQRFACPSTTAHDSGPVWVARPSP